MKIPLLTTVLLTLCPLTQAGPAGAVDSKALAEEVGSLRNAKVAIKLSDPKTQLTFFSSGISKQDHEALKRVVPNLRIVSGLSPKEALARASEAHGIDAAYASPAFFQKAPKLAWVQVMSAGVDRYLGIDPLMKNDSIVLTNCRGVHGPAIADHAMGMLLTITRNLREYGNRQDDGTWSRGNTKTQSVALQGKTMLVIGLGGIGTEIAQRAHGFGMRVIGTRRSDTPSPGYIAKVGKPNDLLKMLPEADVVVIAVPLTPETKHMINKAAISAMKPGSYLVNIARGKIVDTEALVAALKSGKLAGACLDVTDPEPLPGNHALWTMPNVVITPHVAGQSEITSERRNALLRENLRRFAAGEPLLNVVDKRLGY
ncbi:MAG: D-2-hydroxyacid dehydrogenase [Akkermansiaceae bacterium]|nr:D-2-hydroxyacid dehydrogenase [Akkermansiaceae bacterium]